MSVAAIIIIIVLLIVIANGVRIINQYERGVIFRLGKVRPEVKQPGMRLIIPIVDQMRKVALRTVTLPIRKSSPATTFQLMLQPWLTTR
jgi:regulator of protease activity HflC (stomatin/prohibitin superfamily)